MFGIKQFLAAFRYEQVSLIHQPTPDYARDDEDFSLTKERLKLVTESVQRQFVSALENELIRLAGWRVCDNKTAFLWEDERGYLNLVKFHDEKFTHLKWIAKGPHCWGTDLPANICRGRETVREAVKAYLEN